MGMIKNKSVIARLHEAGQLSLVWVTKSFSVHELEGKVLFCPALALWALLCSCCISTSREANGKTISAHSCIFLEVIPFHQQLPDDVRGQEFQKIKKRNHCCRSELLELVRCCATAQERDEDRSGCKKLFQHHNTTLGCLSLHIPHEVFLATTLQRFGCTPEGFHSMLEISQFWLAMM